MAIGDMLRGLSKALSEGSTGDISMEDPDGADEDACRKRGRSAKEGEDQVIEVGMLARAGGAADLINSCGSASDAADTAIAKVCPFSRISNFHAPTLASAPSQRRASTCGLSYLSRACVILDGRTLPDSHNLSRYAALGCCHHLPSAALTSCLTVHLTESTSLPSFAQAIERLKEDPKSRISPSEGDVEYIKNDIELRQIGKSLTARLSAPTRSKLELQALRPQALSQHLQRVYRGEYAPFAQHHGCRHSLPLCTLSLSPHLLHCCGVPFSFLRDKERRAREARGVRAAHMSSTHCMALHPLHLH